MNKIPTLPPGTTLDLSNSTVNLPDVPEFKIPDILSVTAKLNRHHAPGRSEPGRLAHHRAQFAHSPRLHDGWMCPRTTTRCRPRRPRWIGWCPTRWISWCPWSLKPTYSQKSPIRSNSQLRAGRLRQATGKCRLSFCRRLVRSGTQGKAGRGFNQKELQMIGRWYYPRVQLNLKKCATASKRFKDAIRSALDTYDKSTDITPLLKVFENYGTAVPTKVILGGAVAARPHGALQRQGERERGRERDFGSRENQVRPRRKARSAPASRTPRVTRLPATM